MDPSARRTDRLRSQQAASGRCCCCCSFVVAVTVVGTALSDGSSLEEDNVDEEDDEDDEDEIAISNGIASLSTCAVSIAVETFCSRNPLTVIMVMSFGI